MATFKIFEDNTENREKENRGIGINLPNHVAGKGHEKRQTLAVLSNVLDSKRDGEPFGKAALLENKINIKNPTGKCNDENASQKSTLVASFKNAAHDQFKAFKEYESKVEQIKEKNDTPKKDEVDSAMNISHGVLRNPLQELNTGTPMSVSGIMSPMSVDKSTNLDDTADKIVIPRTDRERFFEVEEYQMDILTYLKEAENKHRPKPGYMLKQPDITQSMRTILVDWLVEVCEEYRLQNETLCLAISYIDRFLSYMSVVRAKLQLVGTAAMFIASKYEEIYPPDVGEFVYITDDTYTRSQVLRMEQLILKVLRFDLSVPTALVFTTLYTIMNEVPDKVKFLSMYLCELSLLEADPYLQYYPSKIAAAALAVARYTLEYPIWSKSLEKNIGYTLMDLKEIIQHLNKSYQTAGDLVQQAIQEKYKSNKFHSVSQITPCQIDDEVFTVNDKNHENDRSVRKMISSLAF